MGWDEGSNIWLRAILQGALEGFVIGLVLSVAFFGVGSLLTRFRLTFARATRYLIAIVIAALVAAVTCGLILMTQDWVRDVVVYSPDERFSPAFGWVAGCISGLQQGGAMAAFIALILLVARDWLRQRDA